MLTTQWEGAGKEFCGKDASSSAGGHRAAGSVLLVQEPGLFLSDSARTGSRAGAGPRPNAKEGERPPGSLLPEQKGDLSLSIEGGLSTGLPQTLHQCLEQAWLLLSYSEGVGDRDQPGESR